MYIALCVVDNKLLDAYKLEKGHDLVLRRELEEGRRRLVAPLIFFHRPGEDREEDMLDDNGPPGDPGDEATLEDTGTASGWDEGVLGTANGSEAGTGTADGGSGATSSESTPFEKMAAGLGELFGEDNELPLPGTSRNSGSEGESDEDDGRSLSGSASGSSNSGTACFAQEMRWDRRLEERCSSSISKTASSFIQPSGSSV